MKLWYSAAELADLALPGLPASERGLRRQAEQSGWNRHPRFAREREGRGGGLEYRIELLPVEARLTLLGRCIQPDAGSRTLAEAPDSAPGLAGAAQLARDARLHLVGLYRAFELRSGLGRHTAVSAFADLFAHGRVALPGWVSSSIRRLSARTLWRWLEATRSGEVDRLGIDRGAARRGKGVLAEAEGGAVLAKMLALHAHNPHLSARHLRGLCRDAFGDEVDLSGRRVPMPGLRAFQSALKGLKASHRTELLALHDPDAFRSRNRIAGASAQLVTRLNELWQIDASPADVLCRDGRHSVYLCIDVFSRRIIAHVSRTARADAVGALLRKALIAWGVPERIKTDNGSDFVARQTVRLLASLKIEAETSAPFSPWQKGVVERAIGTMQRDFMPPLPGFIGHSVAERKAIENRKAFSKRLGQKDAEAFQVDLSSAELAARLDRWCAEDYAHRAHGGIGKASPFQMAASWSGMIRRIDNEAALAVLLAPAAGKDGLRQVGKQGIRIDGSHYLAPGILPGETVFVRMDPADLGRIWLFDADGETFRAIAVCAELAGTDPAAAVAAAQAAQKAYIAERLEPIRRAARQIKPRDMADALARQAAKDAGKLAEFPRPAARHTTPALAGAGEAIEAIEIHKGRRAPATRPANAAESAMLARIEAENVAPPAPARVQPLRQGETDHQRFRRALALETRVAAGETIDQDEALWLGGYRQSAEWRAMKRMHEDFGDAALRGA